MRRSRTRVLVLPNKPAAALSLAIAAGGLRPSAAGAMSLSFSWSAHPECSLASPAFKVVGAPRGNTEGKWAADAFDATKMTTRAQPRQSAFGTYDMAAIRKNVKLHPPQGQPHLPPSPGDSGAPSPAPGGEPDGSK